MLLGKSQRDKEPRRVAAIAAYNAEGLFLWGKRNDNGKWTNPGGHMEPGEEPLEAARRELEEETGLKGQDFQYLGRGLAGRDGSVLVYCYRCIAEGEIDTSDDPDEECEEWRWIEPEDIPEEITSNLHSPKNILLRLLGLQEGEVEEPMTKAADPHFVEQNPYSGAPLKIPKSKTQTRKKWDQDYMASLAYNFAGGDLKRLRPIQVPTEHNMGSNMAVNKSRLALYKRMLKAKDRLPPVVVRRNGIGFSLLDGNHRLEAARQSGHTHIHAVEVLDPPLKKGLPGLALVGALATGGGMPAPKPPPAANEIIQQQGIAPAPWTHDGLSPEMWPIAHLESSWGQNQAHATNRKGDFHTAFGALGFKPVTAHEEYLKSKMMQSKYPALDSPENFLKTFKADPKFYNLLASAHFARLKARHGGPQQAAFAWRWGTGACANALPDQITNDAYVQKYTHMKLDQKTGQVIPDGPLPLPVTKSEPEDLLKEDTRPIQKTEQHDPLEAMLAHDDPRERIMALKSRLVTPYHLRLALRDEDPDVRAAAAKHPMMTSALIEEALRHPDLHTREAALSRPDLQEHHLEQAIWDPDLQTQAALHPGLTEDQRQKLIGAQDTPEGLRGQLLAKSIGYLTYPKLGQPSVHTEPMVRQPEQHQAWLVIHDKIKDLRGVTAAGTTSYNRLKNKGLDPKKRQFSASVNANTSSLPATVAHETQHSVFAHLRQKFGNNVGQSIVSQTMQALDPKDLEHLKRITDWKIKNKYNPIKEPEERIAYLQNYLQDGMWRKSAHKAMRIHMDRNAEKISHDWAKQLWQKLRLRAESLGPEHVGVIRKDEEVIGDWIRKHSEPFDPWDQAEWGSSNLVSHENVSRLQDREGGIGVLPGVGLKVQQDEVPDLLSALQKSKEQGTLKAEEGRDQSRPSLPRSIDQSRKASGGRLAQESAVSGLRTEVSSGLHGLRPSRSDHKDQLSGGYGTPELFLADPSGGDREVRLSMRLLSQDTHTDQGAVFAKNTAIDMMGVSAKTEAFLEAAKFLGHTEPDRSIFRRALLEDCSLVDAALISVRLEVTAPNRRALLAIMDLQDKKNLGKADKTHEVQALMADGTEIADGVRRGFASATEQELNLGGKHSAGSMMVRDPDEGQMYLLKPGAGPQSPAAGAREEPANQSRRETAFWHVAEAWGLSQRLPRADLLLIDGKEVAVLHMLPFDWKNLEKLTVKDAGLPHKALEKYRQSGELHKWAIMDGILGNPDRHGQNLMVGPQKEGYPIALIDHGSAFAGPDFDPATDQNSFIPYYLRAWHPEGWGELDMEQKLRSMPSVSGDVDRQLREWFQGINAEDLEAVLFRFGINPAPSVARLAKFKALLEKPNLSEAVNRIWLMT